MFLQWLSSSQKKCRSRATMGNGLVCTQVCASKINGDSYSLYFVCTRRSAVWAAVAMWQTVLELKKINGDPPLALCSRGKQFAFSPGLVLETAVCTRASGVAWFSCVGASLNPAGGWFKPPHLPTAPGKWLEDKKHKVMVQLFPKYLRENPVEHPLVSMKVNFLRES